MEEKKAQTLLRKYLAGDCTEAEKALLESWYLQRELNDFPDLGTKERLQDKQQLFAMLEKTHHPKKHNLYWLKLTAAAALAAVIFGLWFYTSQQTTINSNARAVNKNDIAPGGNKAVLTLANGEVIDLSSDKNGIVIQAGQLAYSDGTEIKTNGSNASEEPAQLNTIATPVGGQYQVILQDGTKVWLNAASSLRYPSRFNSKERNVEISGEAYFDVTHDEKRPFKVRSKGQQVEVLGTAFNIMAYDNEDMVKTTLLRGAVRVAGLGPLKTKIVTLLPGQQSLLTTQQISVNNNPDLEEVVSWKNGYFKFNEDIKNIMNKIARWYNIEVVYRPGVDLSQTFSGEVSKSRNVSVLLKVMELTGNVHFKIEERRIIVMP
ncbi:FecR family protein [Pedobacter heparinus]|uniref:FecR protein n=1 Tax=Pedobacter heparinus (strain ATCC 13125 / DSM 2366 / CIP 104194 / JCM 7457 / NBRC 12017 / NCIMB 9290 / NRRL B-14731 / HIM 762-3) TaxID=485917 RepID=C6XSL4_PEDHD|nr:FecR family protein [Pedobacter heparinus]ACU05577.1 FecR protein [Pedobacter heparinus DSM 2366]